MRTPFSRRLQTSAQMQKRDRQVKKLKKKRTRRERSGHQRAGRTKGQTKRSLQLQLYSRHDVAIQDIQDVSDSNLLQRIDENVIISPFDSSEANQG